MKAKDILDVAAAAYGNGGYGHRHRMAKALAAVDPLIRAEALEQAAAAAEREAKLWMEKAREGVPVSIEDAFKKYATGANGAATAIRAMKEQEL
jgi:hypothetical protein